MSEPLVIWGAGAIGATVGAFLIRAGIPVLFVDTADDHVAAIEADGLAIGGPIDAFSVSAPALAPDAVAGQFKSIFLCVKAHHTAIACAQIAPHLAADGCVVSLQNGLNERVIAGVLGAERTLGAFVNFGADYLAPGSIHFGGRGAVVIGELDGRTTPRVVEFHDLLRQFDAGAVLSDNIWGYLWGKMSYGALLFATALTDEPIADVLASTRHRGLLIALAREVLRVAAAAGVRPEGFDGYAPTAFLGTDAAAASSLDQLVAFNRRSAKTHSGIWRDLAVRRRKTEVDMQLGSMLEIATEHGLQAPITARLVALIHAIEDGARPLAWSTLDELMDAMPPARQ